jgi:hypothetical protein
MPCIRIWLVNLAQELGVEYDASQLQLDGFDIDLAQCPPQEWMPDCVHFHAWNAFNSPDSRFIGQYDVVHVRLFMINVREGSQSAKLIANLRSLLSSASLPPYRIST